jgi:hypothetical protein
MYFYVCVVCTYVFILSSKSNTFGVDGPNNTVGKSNVKVRNTKKEHRHRHTERTTSQKKKTF